MTRESAPPYHPLVILGLRPENPATALLIQRRCGEPFHLNVQAPRWLAGTEAGHDKGKAPPYYPLVILGLRPENPATALLIQRRCGEPFHPNAPAPRWLAGTEAGHDNPGTRVMTKVAALGIVRRIITVKGQS